MGDWGFECQKDTILKLLKDGLTVSEINKETGISRPTIYKWKTAFEKQVDIPQEQREFLLENVHSSDKKLHKQTQIDQKKIRDFFYSLGLDRADRTKIRARKIIELHKRGLMQVAISKIIGYSRQRVQQIILDNEDTTPEIEVDEDHVWNMPATLKEALDLKKIGVSNKMIAEKLGITEMVVEKL